MEGLLPVLGIWALLCAVLVGYVIYRFITDQPKDSKTHRVYPFVSRPTDPLFPPRGAWLQWAAYICLLAVPCGVLGALATEMNLIAAPRSGIIAGVGLLLGLSFIALGKLTGKDK